MTITLPRRSASTLAGSFGPLTVDRHEVVSGDAPHAYYTLRLPDWVNVVAVTEGGLFVLVRQHRYGVDGITLETPGGIINPGEEPEVAGLRELREETGYAADAVEPLGWVHPNPALQGNRCHFYLARGAREVGPPAGDEHESTEAVLMDAVEVAAAVRDGRITHVLAILALERVLARRR